MFISFLLKPITKENSIGCCLFRNFEVQSFLMAWLSHMDREYKGWEAFVGYMLVIPASLVFGPAQKFCCADF